MGGRSSKNIPVGAAMQFFSRWSSVATYSGYDGMHFARSAETTTTNTTTQRRGDRRRRR
jgi:hypothetical protein